MEIATGKTEFAEVHNGVSTQESLKIHNKEENNSSVSEDSDTENLRSKACAEFLKTEIEAEVLVSSSDKIVKFTTEATGQEANLNYLSNLEENKEIVITKAEFSQVYSAEVEFQPEVDGLDNEEVITEDINTKHRANEQLDNTSLIEEQISFVSIQATRNFKEKINMRIDTQVRVLTLNHNEHQDSVLYRIEKNWILQFRLGPSLFGRKVSLFCNYPVEPSAKLDFVRNCYYQLPWCNDEGCENSDDTASYAQVFAELSGSFHYYFTYDDK